MQVRPSLSLHFHLLLNSCDGNDAFWLHSMLVKQSSSFSRKHWTLSLQICVRETVWLTTWICRNVYTVQTPVRDTSRCDQRLEAVPHWHMGKHVIKRHWQNSWSMEKQLCASMKAKWHHFERLVNCNLLFSKPTHYKTGSFERHRQSTEETRWFTSFPSKLFKSK